MESIIECTRRLKGTKTKKEVDSRIREFKKIGNKSNDEIFKELCFCILTANFQAERGIKIQKEMGKGFLDLSESHLRKRLKELGHRYPNMRAKFIAEARKHKNSLKETIESFKDENELREWLVRNMKGLGYKEASHFLRNIGFENLAIIDFHIIDILTKHKLVKRPNTLTKRKYLEIEKILKKIAVKLGMNLAELDLYLWCAETGKVLK
ncbi:MAG: N-glycosylase/DNA lyase [Candidatus Aenigmarchaeota archaeon]|nr:N-glycosylase/DNA lyase [Candidatus Aenigmarchaeota archaeon]